MYLTILLLFSLTLSCKLCNFFTACTSFLYTPLFFYTIYRDMVLLCVVKLLYSTIFWCMYMKCMRMLLCKRYAHLYRRIALPSMLPFLKRMALLLCLHYKFCLWHFVLLYFYLDEGGIKGSMTLCFLRNQRGCILGVIEKWKFFDICKKSE